MIPDKYLLFFGLLGLCCIGACISDYDSASRHAHETAQVDWRKMDGPDRFMKYHQMIRTRYNADAPDYESGDILTAFRQAKKQKRVKRSAPLPWVERGPGNVGGRTRGLWVDPADLTKKTVFAGSAGGGIWKTEDGNSWRNLTTDLPNLSTTTIAGSLDNPQVLYAGTGEGFGAARNIVGSGMWKSEDGGESWEQISSTANRDDISIVYRIIVNPNDANEMLFSTLIHPRAPLGDSISAIMKSTDGGSQIRATYVSDRAIQQLVADPSDFNRIYGVINGRGVVRSLDRGESWQSLMEVDSFRRLELAVSPTNPDFLYLTGELRVPTIINGPEPNGSRLLMSPDGGEQWYNVHYQGEFRGFGDWLGGQGWYNNSVAVHPFDEQTIYVGGAGPILKISLATFDSLRSRYLANMVPLTDGYGEYRQNGFAGASSKGVHVDHHNLLLVPINAETETFYFYNANDGGVALSYDGGETFIQTGDTFKEECADPGCSNVRTFKTSDGYNTGQFYGIDKANGVDRYVGGTQDNGSWLSIEDPDVGDKWIQAPGGDGFEAIWHYDDLNKVIETAQFNTMFRTDDGGESWRRLDPPGSGPFLTRLAGSKQEPNLIFAVTDQALIRSTDFGNNWEVIEMPETWRSSGLPTPTRISLATPNIVWSGSDLRAGSTTTVSQDAGKTFSPISTYGQADLGVMTNIATHPNDDSTAYFLFSQANGPKVIRTTDLGKSLEDISGFRSNQADSDNGYPDVATYCLLVMPYDYNILWAGTEIGLFESTNGGTSWQFTDNGLPPASIWDMKVVNDEIVIGTHGRGVWTVSLPELEGYEPKPVSFLSPEADVNEYALGGLVQGEYELRTPYDSTTVTFTYVVEGDTIKSKILLDANEAADVRSIATRLSPLPNEEIVDVSIAIRSYQNGVALIQRISTYAFAVQDEVALNYLNDFDEGVRDFARLDFFISRPANFGTRSLNSPHPYNGLSEYAAVFQRPILVGLGTSEVSFNEIVLVEPGDSEPFLSSDFYDYCVIEATNDRGNKWHAIEGYDSRAEVRWLNAYEANPNMANEQLQIPRNFDLRDFFADGDTVFLRFRLVSDPFVEGWGWQIDDFQVGNMAVDVENFDDDPGFQVVMLENPGSDLLRLRLRSEDPSTVRFSLYNLQGQMLQQQDLQVMGEYLHTMETATYAPGIYLLRVNKGAGQQIYHWVKQ
ncbi:MAG: T9SS type A sorting domain-containing protein [Saprospiraceae bacterium]|nr:T9SS type A sorting domain-containing protein [Saprospiraceae bacterium]